MQIQLDVNNRRLANVYKNETTTSAFKNQSQHRLLVTHK